MDGFADAVRATARMRQAVAAGVVGAVAACSLAFGAMAADSAYAGAKTEAVSSDAGVDEFWKGQRDLGRQNAEFFLSGLSAIAQADLAGMAPRDAVMTVKAMARRVLKDGPFKADEGFVNDPAVPGSKAVERMTDYLTRLVEQPVITARIAQDDAGAISRKARAMLGAEGIAPKDTSLDFEGVSVEAERRAKAKVEVLREIVAKGGDPEFEGADLVYLANGGEMARAPAQRVLLDRLAVSHLSDEAVPAQERAALARDIASSQAADGAFAAITRLWQEEEHGVDKGRIVKAAQVALSTVDVLARASEPKAEAPAPGR